MTSGSGRGFSLDVVVDETHMNYKHLMCFKQNSICQGYGKFILSDKSDITVVTGINN